MIVIRRMIIYIVLLSVVLLIAGCGPAALSFLKKDSLDEDKGLMIVRLKIKDSSRSFLNVNETFSIQDEGGREHGISMGIDDGRRLGEKLYKYRGAYSFWRKEGDAHYFDQVFFIEAKPGRYYFKDVIVSSFNNTYYEFPLYFACDLTKNGLAVLGTVNINIDKKAGRFEQYKIDYHIDFNESDQEKTQNLERFKAAYPALSKTLASGETMGKAFYAYYELFTSSIVPPDKPIHKRWDDIYDSEQFRASASGPYKLSANYTDKNAYGYAGKKDRLSLSENYTINYSIRWMEGMKDAFYGLRLAQDDKNAYFFGVNAGGHPAIWIKKNGEWQAKPAVKETTMLHAIKNKADDFIVEVQNKQITYKINDEPVGSIAGVLELRSAYTGFFVSGKQKVEVDLFKIVEKK